ncbi:ABC transporter ATP-binding protein [Corynebacterium variabile]|uniref:ABC transporter ATP-binding protein n=1 Tax=Corynebacterium variabile TaxID=1727 RepID=UPI002648C02E|nr:ABC transporter ATP-binding protein [Corynebacterium variabile]MDN6662504.1 ABC transporter ATP-binding protein [Corynebacterium variabile]MDN6814040.1 ABC transporter ATP-binding protein [Corynebacterium variabile]MDN6845330.1 ABC transporter ATP-binding protein [Corynebacterium variabile]
MTTTVHDHSISVANLRVGYTPDRPVISDLSLNIPGGQVTTIIGPNGCGKSTLLRAIGRLIPSQGGEVHLGDTDIGSMKRKDIAKTIGVLPQSPISPPGLIVSDLVSRGRHPHQSWIRQWSSSDEEEVNAALEMTDVAELADRSVDSLSGGQRQRVWISMVLAQHTDVLFLDEPTTYLDLAHSIEVLDLVNRLRRDLDRTVVMVLHDLNLAIRYSDNLVVMRDGDLIATGKPEEIITSELLKDVFELDATVIEDPVVGGPLIVPNDPYDIKGKKVQN